MCRQASSAARACELCAGSGRKGRGHLTDEGYIIEFHQVGAYVKVSAMDPVTLTEVSLPVPANLSQHQAAEAAIRKLKYVLARRNGTQAGGTAGERK
jgi:hypothetical protein